MRTVYLFISLLVSAFSFAQDAGKSLDAAMKKMEAEAQFKHASISLYVVDSKTGKVVYDKNSELGLATASTLKVVTSAAAFELLGKDHRYKTDIGYNGKIEGNKLAGDLIIIPSGDPSFGSWRWKSTTMDSVLKNIAEVLKTNNITAITGDMIIDDSKWSTQATPGGWAWDDIGN